MTEQKIVRKHTPGPWVVDPCSAREISLESNKHFVIASIINADPDGNRQNKWFFGEESKANAKLIAAAPCLLEALDSLLITAEGYGMGENCAAYLSARAAIAKATGQ